MNAVRIYLILVFACCLLISNAYSQGRPVWSADGKGYYTIEKNQLVLQDIRSGKKSVEVPAEVLVTEDKKPIAVQAFSFNADYSRLLIFTNSKKVWRYNTRGDYYILDLKTKKLHQVGKSQPESSLMFAKFSPDGQQVAYVQGNNIYTESANASAQPRQLTTDGSDRIINGTFDWAYEEEFFCRDGFRWGPDSKHIAYWLANVGKTKQYMMVNNTDSIYPALIPVEYPVAGEPITPYRIGVVHIDNPVTTWMAIPGDPLQHYLPRMEWVPTGDQVIFQQLNRKQNTSRIMTADRATGKTTLVYEETDPAWIDISANWDQDYANGGWDWINQGKEFIWASEKDGWRKLYRISLQGKEALITTGAYDVMDITGIDEKNGDVYFMASPENATQKYLYRAKLNGKGNPQRITPATQPGTHNYVLAPGSNLARHSFSNHYTRPVSEWIELPGHKWISGNQKVEEFHSSASAARNPNTIRFFRVNTSDGIEMDGWMTLPANFDSTRKYPVLFYVYTEPWGQLVKDQYGVGNNHLYNGSLADDGYIYIALDNRGTPVPKGREWRKSVYRKIGIINIRDQAMATKEIMKWNFIDTSRIAVWGWSGGGSATLNLMFQYPEIYKTGIAVAAVANQLSYDNIYQERYMGLPAENLEDFIKGSPLTYAKNLKGNLLYIHGTGDDNVHYNNAEMLLNELIKHNKQFQFMPYPNRSHSISEGEGTGEHLSTLFTNYLRQFCPPGGR